MKKLTILLSLLLSAMLCLGAAAEEAIDYAGHWQLLLMQSEGKSATAADLNLDMTLFLHEDGLCTISSGGMIETHLWAVTEGGALISRLDGTSILLTLSEGALMTEVGGVQLIFVPSPEDAAAAPVSARPLSGLSQADFDGRWTLTHVETATDTYAAPELEASVTITLAGGAALIETTTPYGVDTLQATCTLQEVSDSVRRFTLLWASAPGCDSIPLMRYDDGLLVWYHYDHEAQCEYFYCFSPAGD